MYSVHQERLTCQKREREIGSRRLEDRPDKCEQDVLGQADSWTVDTNGISWSATHTGTHMDVCCLPGELQSHKDKRERERGKLQVVVVVAVTVLVVVFILSLKTLVKSAPGHGHRATESHPFLASTTPA